MILRVSDLYCSSMVTYGSCSLSAALSDNVVHSSCMQTAYMFELNAVASDQNIHVVQSDDSLNILCWLPVLVYCVPPWQWLLLAVPYLQMWTAHSKHRVQQLVFWR